MLTGIAGGVFMGVLLSAVFVMAGDLAPSAGPTEAGSQMYTLEQIYDRLNAGTAGSKKTSFSDPSSGPSSTGHTLDDTMGKAPVVNANGASVGDVVAGKTFWGLTSGEWGPRTGTGVSCAGGFSPLGRWCDNLDGTVTDTKTRLINCLIIVSTSCCILCGFIVVIRTDPLWCFLYESEMTYYSFMKLLRCRN